MPDLVFLEVNQPIDCLGLENPDGRLIASLALDVGQAPAATRGAQKSLGV